MKESSIKLFLNFVVLAFVLLVGACPSETKPHPPTPIQPDSKIPKASAADENGFVTISAGSMALSVDASYYVTLTKPYKICDHEVTQAEWQAVMGNNPSIGRSNSAVGEVQENRPVEHVTWYGAISYCNKRSIKEGLDPVYSVQVDDEEGKKIEIDWENLQYSDIPTVNDTNWNNVTCDFSKDGYRLPTEAEWEIAARGGLIGDVYSGTDVSKLEEYAWFKNNSENKTHEVKKKKPNGYGLYDMSGNVYEWCWDWYGDYITNEATDPTGAESGLKRVGRGGFFRSLPKQFLSHRGNAEPKTRNRVIGFRLARSCQ